MLCQGPQKLTGNETEPSEFATLCATRLRINDTRFLIYWHRTAIFFCIFGIGAALFICKLLNARFDLYCHMLITHPWSWDGLRVTTAWRTTHVTSRRAL